MARKFLIIIVSVMFFFIIIVFMYSIADFKAIVTSVDTIRSRRNSFVVLPSYTREVHNPYFCEFVNRSKKNTLSCS